jgi:hypothetical protein
MNRDTGKPQEHILDQVTISALAPTFTHPDIAEQYQGGQFNRLEAEVADILRSCLSQEEQDGAAPMLLSAQTLPALRDLNCIALIQDGQALPLLDIEKTTAPVTAMQKAQLYHAAARTLLEAITAIYEDRAERGKSRSQGDDNEGGSCYAC